MSTVRFIPILFLLFLTSCSVPDFYRFQGVNASECGPSVGCMVAYLHNVNCQFVRDARVMNEDVKYWDFKDIADYLHNVGVEQDEDSDDIVIYKISFYPFKPHFIMVINETVYDPFFGVYPFSDINPDTIFDKTLHYSFYEEQPIGS